MLHNKPIRLVARRAAPPPGCGVPESGVKVPPWWLNPLWYCLLILLPLFVGATFSMQPYMEQLDQRTNNLSTENILLGVLSIGMFMLGCLPFTWRRVTARPSLDLDMGAVNGVLTFMGGLSLAAYLIYFSSLAANPHLIMEFLSGSADSMVNVRQAMEQIPGITSFVHAAMPFLALYSVAAMHDGGRGLSTANRRLLVILAVMIVARAILGSERLAMVEAAVAYAVPRVTFIWRPTPLRAALPYLGVVMVFGLFCVGEYFRSWQYYKMYYPSFLEFISVRFLGYFVTSINNGAGIVSHYPPLGYPGQTADGFYRMLKIFGIDFNPGDDVLNQYLKSFATLEFNNAGGLYIPYMDYGTAGGALCFLIMGGLTGFLYRRFVAMWPLALLLYPAWYIALLDIIRIWIWGSSQFVPIVLVSVVAALVLHGKRTAGRA